MTISEIKNLCRKYDIYPSRSKGQNFLLCEEALCEVVDASDIKSKDIVLEIGPGFGVLTKRIAARAAKAVGVELDGKLYAAAKDILKVYKNVEIINHDILKLSEEQLKELTGGSYKITANLPYSITGSFLKKFLTLKYKPDLMSLMLQKEVAERICALPGDMSLLSVSAQYYSNPQIVSKVPKECFYPVPEVDSAIVRFEIKKTENDADEKKFFQIARIGFSARRKMLKNNLFNGFKGMGKEIFIAKIEKILQEIGLKNNARAQDLSVEDWKRLAEKIEI